MMTVIHKYEFTFVISGRDYELTWVDDEPFEDGDLPAWQYEILYEKFIVGYMEEHGCPIDEVPDVFNLTEKEFSRIMMKE